MVFKNTLEPGETLTKNLFRKLKRHLDKPFKLRSIYLTKKLCYHGNTKDKVPEYHIVYGFCCPACNNKYTGKADRKIGILVQEHKSKLPASNHVLECEHVNYVVNIHSLSPSNKSVEYIEHV